MALEKHCIDNCGPQPFGRLKLEEKMHEISTVHDDRQHGGAWMREGNGRAAADHGESENDATPRSMLELAAALGTEMHNLRHLLETLQLQRTAIAKSDVDAINENIFAMRRLLLTLSEARRYRELVVEKLGAPPDIAPRWGDAHEANRVNAPPWSSASIQSLRDELQKLAAEVAREVETNRKILFGVIAAGEELIRVIVGAVVPGLGAGIGAASINAGPHAAGNQGVSEGALINRVV